MRADRIEAMTNIFDELGIKATDGQIKEASEAFADHLDMEREMESYQFIGGSEDCSSCQSLRDRLEEKEKEVDVYKNSVKRRRNADQVWLDGDTVRYG